MTKTANTNIPLSPEEAYLASRTLGGSLFSAIQLSKELERLKREQREQEDNTLVIPIPMEKLKMAEDSPGWIGRALRLNRSPITTIAGADQGFNDARTAYYELEKKQIQQELAEAQKDYLSVLSRIKTAESTPMVDSFCEGIASELSLGDIIKQADEPEISDGSLRRLLSDALGVAKKPIQPAIDLGATGLLGTAAGSGYLVYLLKKHMRGEDSNSYGPANEPTRVQLEPVKL
jgi:hypothetical protein